MYDIDWTKIKNDSKGFEDLAREYVKDVFSFPYGEWKETSTTHDGNKDAYTIIIGFHPNLLENEVWWMEAKYSTERMYLSRFKLDATIVSSIFNRSVSKIIFVTNIEIKAKVIHPYAVTPFLCLDNLSKRYFYLFLSLFVWTICPNIVFSELYLLYFGT